MAIIAIRINGSWVPSSVTSEELASSSWSGLDFASLEEAEAWCSCQNAEEADCDGWD